MPGPVPGIVLIVQQQERRGWPGQARTSPAMTKETHLQVVKKSLKMKEEATELEKFWIA
jgi:hypothetical protein